MIGVDFETFQIKAGQRAPPPVCMATATQQPGEERLLLARPGLQVLRGLLNSHTKIAGSNFAFDAAVACMADASLIDLFFEAYERGDILDTHAREMLRDIERGTLFRDPSNGAPFKQYKLEMLTERWLGYRLEKENTYRLKYAQFDGVPLHLWPPEAIDYPKKDARASIDVVTAQDGSANLHCEIATNREAFALNLSAVYGLRTDPALVPKVVADVTKEHEERLAKFTNVGIYRGTVYTDQKTGTTKPTPLNKIGTMDKGRLAELITLAYQGTPPLTPTGRVSTNRDTLAESGDDLLEDFAENTNEKDFSTYLKVIQQGTHIPICPGITILVRTGRTSYWEPNLQNLPRDGKIRECFVPRPGFLYIGGDFGGAELATLAQTIYSETGASKMRDVLLAGKDLHREFAHDFLGGPTDDLRQVAKIPNFGLPGGLSADALIGYGRGNGVRFCEAFKRLEKCGSQGKVLVTKKKIPACIICRDICRWIHGSWFSMWSDMHGYFERRQYEVNAGGSVTLDAPVEWARLTRGKCTFTQAANFKFQGLAAQAAKHAFWKVSKECHTKRNSSLWGTHPVLFVHDEIIAEAPENMAPGACDRMVKVMQEAYREIVPDVPVRVEPRLMRRWYKAAKSVRDSKGRLIPWEPKEKRAA